MDYTPEIFFSILGVVFFIFIIGFCFYYHRQASSIKTIIAEGYNIEEVTTFLNNTGWEYEDFANSQGVRKAYQNFLSGEIPTQNTNG